MHDGTQPTIKKEQTSDIQNNMDMPTVEYESQQF